MTADRKPNLQQPSVSQEESVTEKPDQARSDDRAQDREKRRTSFPERLVNLGVWLMAISLVFLAGYLGWQKRATIAAAADKDPGITPSPVILPTEPVTDVDIPGFVSVSQEGSIHRQFEMHTIIPTRPREEKTDYTVEQGDSVFAIAQKFNLTPETILWANYDLLEDRPDSLSVGMVLNIPPVNGVYYQWKEGDSLESVASMLKATPEDILNWPGNNLDLTKPEIAVGDYVMVPDGEREFRSWIVPQIARGKAGVSPSVYGAGACQGSYEGAYGSGGFIWPAINNFLSGNDFWSGHLGIDIAGGIGDSVLASDSGVVVFAGWATGGYGYMIMIDHGNGYQTVYAHLSNVAVACGQSVYQGNYIGAIGSTGNSTGSHLHFEVRLWGQFVNPWHVLP